MRPTSARTLKITVTTDTYAQSCPLGRLASRAHGTPSAPGRQLSLFPPLGIRFGIWDPRISAALRSDAATHAA
jgi:hypothetical protein